MAVSVDNFHQRVIYTEGEAVEDVDLTNQQIYEHLGQFQNFRVSGIADYLDDPTAPGTILDLENGRQWNLQGLASNCSDLVFAPYPGCGFFAPNGVANQLESIDGPLIFIDDDDPFGGDPDRVCPFRLPFNVVLTTAAGHATHPRIDLVELRCEWFSTDSTSRNFQDEVTRALTSTSTNKRRAVQVTIQIRQGTAAATPAYPAPTTGYAAIGAILVPATHNAAHDVANWRDLRMPMGKVVPYDVPAHLMYRQGATPWTLATSNWCNVAPSLADFLYAQCPVGAMNGRLVGVGLYGDNAGGSTCNLKRILHDGVTPTFTTLCNLQLGDDLFNTPEAFRTKTVVQLMDDFAGAGSAYAGTRLTNRRIGTPMWCNTHPAGPAVARAANADDLAVLAIEINGDMGSTVSLVRFYVAQGM